MSRSGLSSPDEFLVPYGFTGTFGCTVGLDLDIVGLVNITWV